MMDLLRKHAAHDGAPMLERHRRVVRDRHEQRSFLIRERRVAVADELADLAPLPAQRKPYVVRPGAPFRPGDVAVSSTSAAPVAPTASIVVFTIASTDSSR